MNDIDFRYYRGVIPCHILTKDKKKALIEWDDYGEVGNKELGYKYIKPYERDIVPIRMCWRRRKE